MKTTVKKTVSMPAELLEMALRKAREQHRSLSSYIQFLIAQDAEKNCESEQISSPA
jgi:uncharacterized protein YigA (DUF484 family)